ncbi:MAG: hypothetical protein ACI8XB_002520 [Patiriisocius sp.]|jgi:hypothetical protein
MKLNQTHVQFWIFIPLLFVIALIFPSPVELYVYIDHYTINMLPMAIGLSVFLLLSGIGYYINREKEMLPNFTRLHKRFSIVGSLMCLLTFVIVLIKNKDVTTVPDIKDLPTFTLDQGLGLVFTLGVFILFLGFVLYIVNTAITTFYTKTKQE